MYKNHKQQTKFAKGYVNKILTESTCCIYHNKYPVRSEEEMKGFNYAITICLNRWLHS